MEIPYTQGTESKPAAESWRTEQRAGYTAPSFAGTQSKDAVPASAADAKHTPQRGGYAG